MPVFLSAILNTLLGMGLALLTGPVIKKLIIMLAEQGIAYYERKAAASPDKNDDAIAKFCRDILTMAEKEWEKV